MKSFLISLFLSACTLKTFAGTSCITNVLFVYIGPSGGTACVGGSTNCVTLGNNPIGIACGDTCSDEPPTPNADIWVDLHNCAYPCAQGGVGVVQITAYCSGFSTPVTKKITMPANRCFEIFYVYGWCGNGICQIDYCPESAQSDCACSD